jgi:purine-cytosine permease-like protein
MTAEDIEKRIKRLATRAYIFGAIVGLLLGIALGFAIGYSQGDRTIVIPLSEGIET